MMNFGRNPPFKKISFSLGVQSERSYSALSLFKQDLGKLGKIVSKAERRYSINKY